MPYDDKSADIANASDQSKRGRQSTTAGRFNSQLPGGSGLPGSGTQPSIPARRIEKEDVVSTQSQAFIQAGSVSSPSSKRSSQRHSRGFLLGNGAGQRRHFHVTSQNGHREENGARNGMGDRTSTSSPRSGRSLKSQGKAPEQSALLVGKSRAHPESKERFPIGGNASSWMNSSSINGRARTSGSMDSDSSRRSAPIDPNQLVNMALALSDSRRSASSGFPYPQRATSNRRIVSADAQSKSAETSALLPANSTPSRESMLRAPMLSDSPTPFSARRKGISAITKDPLPGALSDELNQDISAGTRLRVERAKRYFELCHQYRRAMTCLPPLKPTETVKTKPGAISSVGRERQYNPLQYLRNEQLRRRQGKDLIPHPNEFDDVDRVVEYVEEMHANPWNGSDSDLIRLPLWCGDSPRNKAGITPETLAAKTVITESAWSFTPSALFADMIWTENPNNKWAIEDRHGERLFASLSPPLSSINGSKADSGPSRLNSDVIPSTDDANQESAPEHRGRQKRKFLSIHKLEDDERRRLPWRRHRSISSSRASSRSSLSAFGISGANGLDSVNIGPLTRHMQKQMQQAELQSPDDTTSPVKWDELPVDAPTKMEDSSRHGISTTLRQAPRSTLKLKPLDLHKSRSYTEGLGDRKPESRQANGLFTPTSGDLTIKSAGDMQRSMPLSADSNASSNLSPRMLDSTRREPPFHVARRADAMRSSGQISGHENDIVGKGRHSLDSVRAEELANSGLQKGRTMTSDSKRSMTFDRQGHGKRVSKLIKGSRLADFIRGESSRRQDEQCKKDGTQSPQEATLSSAHDSEGSDSDDYKASLRRGTEVSTSTTFSTKLKYHRPLPSFKFPNGLDDSKDVVVGDPISRQSSIRKQESITSRHSNMAPPPIQVPPTDPRIRGKSDKSEEGEGLRGLLSPIKRLRAGTGPSRPGSIKTVPTRVDGRIAEAVELDDAQLGQDSLKSRKRQWSIANDLPRLGQANGQTVTIRDIERVRALFLISGIKACELCRRGEECPEEPSHLLVEAAQATNHDLQPTAKRLETRKAGQLWSEAIIALSKSSEQELRRFRDVKAPQLRDGIEKLRHEAGEELTVRVQSASDEADAFSTDLATHQTLAVKDVHDAVDSLLRKRRRNWRMLRRFGFAVLEWVLLGVMWLAWFLFTIFKMVKLLVVGVFKVVAWLFAL